MTSSFISLVIAGTVKHGSYTSFKKHQLPFFVSFKMHFRIPIDFEDNRIIIDLKNTAVLIPYSGLKVL